MHVYVMNYIYECLFTSFNDAHIYMMKYGRAAYTRIHDESSFFLCYRMVCVYVMKNTGMETESKSPRAEHGKPRCRPAFFKPLTKLEPGSVSICKGTKSVPQFPGRETAPCPHRPGHRPWAALGRQRNNRHGSRLSHSSRPVSARCRYRQPETICPVCPMQTGLFARNYE